MWGGEQFYIREENISGRGSMTGMFEEQQGDSISWKEREKGYKKKMKSHQVSLFRALMAVFKNLVSIMR